MWTFSRWYISVFGLNSEILFVKTTSLLLRRLKVLLVKKYFTEQKIRHFYPMES